MSNDFPFSHFLKNSNTNENKNEFLPPEQSKILNKENEHITSDQNSNIWSQDEIEFLDKGIHQYLSQNLPLEKYDTFFKDHLKLSNITNTEAQFFVPTPLIKSLILEKFLDFLTSAMLGTLGKPYTVIITTKEEENKENINNYHQNSSMPISTASKATFKLDLEQTRDDMRSSIDSTYIEHMNNDVGGMIIDSNKTFDNFIVGPSNNLAFATANAAGKNPGKEGQYPCLYIYSHSGLGKTHLLHAVANEIKENRPEQSVCIISAREFMKEMINSMKDRNIGSFQKKYCEQIDVLMIDDIHQLKNKTGTQEEFFHIFNELHSKGKQLIFTSDKSPKEIDGIEERIITRLQWGLVIDIQKPDLETRSAILKKKALELDLFVPDDIINLIASTVKTSIRELEGNLIRLRATADLMNVELDTEMVKDLLNLSLSDDGREITLEIIARATSQFYKIPLADLKSKSRNKDIVKARHVAWYLSKKLIDSTLKEIAKFFGGRDHSSVIHGINRITALLKEDRQISKDITYLENNL